MNTPHRKHEVDLPQSLTYESVDNILTRHHKASYDAEEVVINWSSTVYGNLPEFVRLLNWSSSLAKDRSVRWELPNPSSLPKHHIQLTDKAQIDLGDRYYGIATKTREIRSHVLSEYLYPNARKTEINRFLGELRKAGLLTENVKTWFNCQLGNFRCLDLFAYMKRYNVFQAAVDCNIKITPDPLTLPMAKLERADSTPCLELSRFVKEDDVNAMVTRFTKDDIGEQNELVRVLGKYAQLDVAERGAFSQILIEELGRNIIDHSGGDAGWICTRLVDPQRQKFDQHDPVIECFRERQVGFFELIITDNGNGIANSLEQPLKEDPRKVIKEKYRCSSEGTYSAMQLIDYAFDRLSTSKRSLKQLLHVPDGGVDDLKGLEIQVLATSGLYWVWSVLKSHNGVLSVQSNDSLIWYDFFSSSNSAIQQQATKEIPTVGTTIRLLFPLRPSTVSRPALGMPKTFGSNAELPLCPKKVIWVGDVRRQRGAAAENLDRGCRVLENLKAHYDERTNDDEIFIVDVSGVESFWLKDSVLQILCFFFEMNFTATSGRSAVILWNVPYENQQVFKDGFEIVRSLLKQFKDFRRACMWIDDKGFPHLEGDESESVKKLARAINTESQFPLDDLIKDESDRRHLRTFISENPHLFTLDSDSEVKARITPEGVVSEAGKQRIDWLRGRLDLPIEDGGIKWEKPGFVYRLSSTGKYVNRFFGFSRLFSCMEDFHTIEWLMLTSIRKLIKKSAEKDQPRYIVTVTRSTKPLVSRISEILGLESISEPTFEDLGCKHRSKTGKAILLTDVISSGTLCARIRASVPNIQWIATVALLDTRSDGKPDDGSPKLFRRKDLPTGKTYSLLAKKVVFIDEPNGKKVIPIDKINVCPVITPALEDYREFDIWNLHRHENVLFVGHYSAGQHHHYTYYINASNLFDSIEKDEGNSLMDLMVEDICNKVGEVPSEEIVILHPPIGESYGESIAIRVQSETGAKFRVAVYRDSLGSQRRFAVFPDNGVPIKNATVIIVDDGANTSESIIGMIDAAITSHPKRVIAYVGIARMPIHKMDFLGNLEKFTGDVQVEVNFGVWAAIPVYDEDTCPACSLKQGLRNVSELGGELKEFASGLIRCLDGLPAGREARTHEVHPLVCKGLNPYDVAQLREAIEMADLYHEKSEDTLKDNIDTATSGSNSKRLDATYRIVTIICLEPTLLNAAVLAPNLKDIERSIENACKEEISENIIPLSLAMLYLSIHENQSRINAEVSAGVKKALEALITRKGNKKHEFIGQLVSLMGGLAYNEKESNISATKDTIRLWLEHMGSIFDSTNEFEYSSIRGRMLIKQAKCLFVDNTPINGMFGRKTDISSLANYVAQSFKGHDPSRIGTLLSEINEAIKTIDIEKIKATINKLMDAFDKLHSLILQLGYNKKIIENELALHLDIELCDNEETIDGLNAVWKNMVEIQEQINKGEFESRKCSSTLKELVKVINEFVDCVDCQFQELLPSIQEIAQIDADTTVQSPLYEINPAIFKRKNKWATEESERERVFMPKVLIDKFFKYCFKNLLSHGFNGWDDKDLYRKGKVKTRISKSADGRKCIIEISDNGSTGNQQEAQEGSHKSLELLGKEVALFDGEILTEFSGSCNGGKVKLICRIYIGVYKGGQGEAS